MSWRIRTGSDVGSDPGGIGQGDQPAQRERNYGSGWQSNGLRILAKLTDGAFHHTLDQKGMKFDVYGVSHDDIGWYVKLTIDNVLDDNGNVAEQVFTIACHPLEKALKTNGGEVHP